MLQLKAPIIYEMIAERLWRNRNWDDKINVHLAKGVLYLYKVPRERTKEVFKELQDMGLIRCNQQYLYILWRPAPLS